MTLNYDKMISVMADAMMEHLPSSTIWHRGDPTGRVWTRSIAETLAKSALEALQGELPEISGKQSLMKRAGEAIRVYNQLKNLEEGVGGCFGKRS